MQPLISLNKISKSFGSKSLFNELSLTFHSGEKVAVIGKNGSGKSTLLKIIAGLEPQDSGEVIAQKHTQMSYVPQSPQFDPESTIEFIISETLKKTAMSEDEQIVQLNVALYNCGFTDFSIKVGTLSGGWIKRLSIAQALCIEPDLLLMDEPTNHMDWEAIEWLENLLKGYKKTLIVISHDRSFLNAVTKKTIEIGQAFMDQHLSFDVSYDDFLEKREDYFIQQEKLANSLGNKARRELEWLRAGVKARTTKSQSRIDEAHKIFDQLKQTQDRIKSSKQKVQIRIDTTNRQSKKLIELKNVTKSYGDQLLFEDLSFVLSPGMRLALLGDNGSGKTTLVKIIQGTVEPTSGEVNLAEKLKVVYFDQNKAQLDPESSLFQFLGEGGDYVLFNESSMHVASYASKFLFSSDHFHLKISQLSGGEKARLQLAKLLLQPCDVLILDEPTNDLDIDSLVTLEENLKDLKIGLILISHDRSFIQEVCTDYLALEGNGAWNFYADLSQWLKNRKAPKNEPKKEASKSSAPPKDKKKKLSYKEIKELESIEKLIQENEKKLMEYTATLEQPEVQTSGTELLRLTQTMAELEKTIQKQYARWQQLEDKK